MKYINKSLCALLYFKVPLFFFFFFIFVGISTILSDSNFKLIKRNLFAQSYIHKKKSKIVNRKKQN